MRSGLILVLLIDTFHSGTTLHLQGIIIASLLSSACLTDVNVQTNQCHYYASTCEDANKNPIVAPLNVWIQTGSYVFSYCLRASSNPGPIHSYVLIALSEIFASITGLEYAFTKAPVNMRSCVMAIFLFTSAISSAIGEAFVCTYFPLYQFPNSHAFVTPLPNIY